MSDLVRTKNEQGQNVRPCDGEGLKWIKVSDLVRGRVNEDKMSDLVRERVDKDVRSCEVEG